MRFLIIFFLLFTSMLPARQKENLTPFFGGHKGTIIIFNKTSNKEIIYNAKRSRERFTPASTFKIPNSLFGLESGVINDENFIIKWDGQKRSSEEWNRDHTLASAIKYSVVPYYQELARRVGKNRLREYLKSAGYGNKSIGRQVDLFWLDNSLKISAAGQIEFLQKFYCYELPFSRSNVDIVKKIMPSKTFGNVKISFKTGTGEISADRYIGWLVGYIEKGPELYFFSFNIEAKTFDEVKSLRDEIPWKIFEHLKIVEDVGNN